MIGHGKIHCIQELFQTFPFQEKDSLLKSDSKYDDIFEEMTQFAALLDCFVQVGILESLQAQKSQLLSNKSPEVVQIDEKIRAESERCLENIGIYIIYLRSYSLDNLLHGPLFGDSIEEDPYDEILVIRGIYVPYLIDKMYHLNSQR